MMRKTSDRFDLHRHVVLRLAALDGHVEDDALLAHPGWRSSRTGTWTRSRQAHRVVEASRRGGTSYGLPELGHEGVAALRRQTTAGRTGPGAVRPARPFSWPKRRVVSPTEPTSLLVPELALSRAVLVAEHTWSNKREGASVGGPLWEAQGGPRARVSGADCAAWLDAVRIGEVKRPGVALRSDDAFLALGDLSPALLRTMLLDELRSRGFSARSVVHGLARPFELRRQAPAVSEIRSTPGEWGGVYKTTVVARLRPRLILPRGRPCRE